MVKSSKENVMKVTQTWPHTASCEGNFLLDQDVLAFVKEDELSFLLSFHSFSHFWDPPGVFCKACIFPVILE